MDTSSAQGLLGWLGLGGAVNALAAGYGQGLATRGVNSGRSPGAEQFTNPLQPPAGGAGQPGTTPVVGPSILQQSLPFLLIGGAVLGVALVIRMFRK